jgi:hypothetical protein
MCMQHFNYLSQKLDSGDREFQQLFVLEQRASPESALASSEPPIPFYAVVSRETCRPLLLDYHFVTQKRQRFGFDCPSLSWDHFLANFRRLVQERADRRALLNASNGPQLPVVPPSSRQYEDCTICFDAFAEDQKVATLPCGHVFHPHCVSRWLSEALRRTCPVCRRATALTSVLFARFVSPGTTSDEKVEEEQTAESVEESKVELLEEFARLVSAGTTSDEKVEEQTAGLVEESKVALLEESKEEEEESKAEVVVEESTAAESKGEEESEVLVESNGEEESEVVEESTVLVESNGEEESEVLVESTASELEVDGERVHQ